MDFRPNGPLPIGHQLFEGFFMFKHLRETCGPTVGNVPSGPGSGTMFRHFPEVLYFPQSVAKGVYNILWAFPK